MYVLKSMCQSFIRLRKYNQITAVGRRLFLTSWTIVFQFLDLFFANARTILSTGCLQRYAFIQAFHYIEKHGLNEKGTLMHAALFLQKQPFLFQMFHFLAIFNCLRRKNK